ncbi:MAG TPA: YIP1 family protein [Gemmatimonadaceae bacterium]|nr:YIP1 family protein [Gemmatimonadaceae bacterium]
MSGPATPAKPTPLWEDFVDIFVSPAEVFERRQRASFALPLLILTVLVGALYLGTRPALQPVFDAVWERQGVPAMMRRNPQMTADQIAGAKKFQENIISPIAITLSIPISVALTALALWLLGRLVDAKQDLRASFVVSTYSYFPKVLAFAAAAIIASLSDPASLTSVFSATLGVGHFLSPDTTSPIALALLGRIEVFILWTTVLLGIGLHVVGKVSMAKAMGVAAIIWVLGALPGILQALQM